MQPERLCLVGGLDFESGGLILMTDDGDQADQQSGSRQGHEKGTRVLLARRPDDRQLLAWAQGDILDDGHRTAPAKVSFSSSTGKGAWVV